MEREYSQTTKRLNRFHQPTLNNNALYRRLDLIHVSYEPPLFNPSLQSSSSLSFHERINVSRSKNESQHELHATQLANVTVLKACVSPPSFDVSKNREMSRDERNVMENTGRPCSCCPMELQISVPAPSYEFICRLCTR